MYSNQNSENLKKEEKYDEEIKTSIESLRKEKIRQLELDITDELLKFESKEL